MVIKGAKERFYQIVISSIVVLLAFITAFPLYYTVLNSLTPEAEMRRRTVVVYPTQLTTAAYEVILTDPRIPPAMLVTVERTLVGTALTLIFTTVGAYILSRKRLPGRKWLIAFVMVTVVFGGGLVPSFLTVMNVGLLDTFWALVIPGLVDSWGLLVIKLFYEGMPKEMEEAAFIDGASEMQHFLRIALPTSVPVLAAIGLFNAVGHWNSWFDAMLYLTTSKRIPMQLLVRNIMQGLAMLSAMAGSHQPPPVLKITNSDAIKMAMVVVATVPILCVYPFLQKYFAKGVFMGAVKG